MKRPMPKCLGCGTSMTFIHADHFVRKNVFNLEYEFCKCKASLTEKGVKFE